MVKYRRGPFLLAAAVAFLAGALMAGEVEAGSQSGENGLGWAAAWSACNGTIGECLGGEEAEEMAMESESNRRILGYVVKGGYLGYGVLNPSKVPCGKQGVPYKYCRPSATTGHKGQRRPCVYQCDRHTPPAYEARVRD